MYDHFKLLLQWVDLIVLRCGVCMCVHAYKKTNAKQRLSFAESAVIQPVPTGRGKR